MQLPDYMVPKAFLVVRTIPRTSSAKVDRAALKNLYVDVDLGAWERKLALTEEDGQGPTKTASTTLRSSTPLRSLRAHRKAV